MKLKLTILSLFLLLSLITSCNSDDDSGYVDVDFSLGNDIAQVIQQQSIVISIFENDSNVPSIGIFSVENPLQGSISIQTNETSETITDDVLVYTANETFEGEEIINYTVCSSDGSNCTSATITITVIARGDINANLSQVPHLKLSEYNFFEGVLEELNPNNGVIPYEPISSLFSDYAHKKRFVWLPDGQKATYNGDHAPLEFPIGSIIIKNFFYENVLPDLNTFIIETRLMIRIDSNEEWLFAEYFWNDEQTEAFYDTAGDGGFKFIQWLENGVPREVNYRMPSGSECFTCHKSVDRNVPIGVKPQNLNGIYEYDEGLKNQLQKWIEVGYLENNLPTDINTVIDYKDTSQSLEMRVRSYVDINCASCHRDEGHCSYRPMRFAFFENDQPESLGVCVEPDQFLNGLVDQKLIKPGDPENSVIYFRVNNTDQDMRMPLLGRNIIDDQGVALLAEWINSLETPCN
ncbi:Ig-like domain-containing protein [Patiriisocius sp. Uisw_017]|jgi:uncharacterized repeat protein (TIGR03806 family)|uniref:Ig-like domain-containing protein n=1 Tax=Patiriisocius sp. Uisw_017 TaxID=3230968 RepID=UPI0039E8430B